MLLGRASGAVSVLALVRDRDSDASATVGPGTAAGGLALLPYEVAASSLGAGPVAALAPPVAPSSSIALVAHADTGATVWDLRREAAVARAPRAGAAAVAWAAADGSLFATGHADGAVVLWRPPKGAPAPSATRAPPALAPAAVLSLALAGARARPLRGLWLAPPGVLAWGGRGEDNPMELTVIDPAAELAALAPASAPALRRALPWFGAVRAVALIPPSPHCPAARPLVLAESGSLMAYGGGDGAPAPLATPLAALPATTAAAAAPAADEAGRRDGHDTALLHCCTPESAAAAGAARLGARAPAPQWRGLVGAPPPGPHLPPPTRLLFTGHEDGRLRVWDSGGHPPTLLDASPWAGAPRRPRAATAVAARPAAGLAITGHERGGVCVHQFCAAARVVAAADVELPAVGGAATLAPAPPPPDGGSPQPPGWQLVLTAAPAAAASPAVTALALAPCEGLAAAGDAGGAVVCLDLATPRVAWRVAVAGSAAVVALEFVAEPVAAGSLRRSRLVLLAALADGALAALDAAAGTLLARAVATPTLAGLAPCLVPLTAAGAAAALPAPPLALAWAGRADASDAPPPAVVEDGEDGGGDASVPPTPAADAPPPPPPPPPAADGAHLVAPSTPAFARRTASRDSDGWEVGPPRPTGSARASRRTPTTDARALDAPPPPGDGAASPAASRRSTVDLAGSRVASPEPEPERARAATADPASPAPAPSPPTSEDEGELLTAALTALKEQKRGRGRRASSVAASPDGTSPRRGGDPPGLPPGLPAPEGAPEATGIALVAASGAVVVDLAAWLAAAAAAAEAGAPAPAPLPVLSKAAIPAPPLAAWTVTSPGGGPGLAIVAGGALHVFALPSLARLSPAPPPTLDAALGFPWPAGATLAAGAADGVLLLFGGGGEVARVGVLAASPAPPPLPPLASELRRTAEPAAVPTAPPAPRQSTTSYFGAALLATAAAAAGGGLVESLASAADRLRGARGGPSRGAPSLAAVFMRRKSDADEAGDGEDGVRAALFGVARAAAPSSSSRPVPPLPRPHVGTRTADEIRAAYGRPLPSRARPDAAVAALAETRAALAARGERLDGLAVATDALAADAAGFEAAAKALRDRAGRKWWHL